MSILTPLSIKHHRSPKSKNPRTTSASYEDRVKNRSFKQNPDETKHHFGSSHRNVSAEDKFDKKEVFRIAPAPLPALASKAPKVVPYTTKASTDLPPLGFEVESAVHSSIEAAATLLDIAQTANASPTFTKTPAESPAIIASTSFYNSSLDPRHQPTLHLSYKPRSISPSSNKASSNTSRISPGPTAEQNLSPFEVSKANIAKLNAEAAKNAELPPSALVHKSDVDEESIDDINTESDLETHAGDEDDDYVANPEEEEEEHVAMRTRMKEVGLKKRTHADVEEAEDGEIVGGSTNGSGGNGNVADDEGERRSASGDLTDKGNIGPRGKKVRVEEKLETLQTCEG